jgi:hypothetical protein
LIAEALKWVWLGLLALGSYVWNSLTVQVKKNSEALSEHIMDDLKSHEELVKKAELKEIVNSLTRRFDKLDEKGDDILTHLMEGVSRTEFKDEMKGVYSSIDDLRKSKADK